MRENLFDIFEQQGTKSIKVESGESTSKRNTYIIMLLSRFAAVSLRIKTNQAHKRLTSKLSNQLRCFSSTNVGPSQPTALTKDMANGIQDATKLFMEHGIGMQKMKVIAKEAEDVDTIVGRWQSMMEAYLGTQVHVLAGLGYTPDESGLRKFFNRLAPFFQESPQMQLIYLNKFDSCRFYS